MTTKHTPGPWHYAECQMGTPFVDTEAVGDLFAAALPLDEEIANVRLMAAAPDLLGMLEMMAAQHFCGCRHPACKRCKDDDDCADVIAKAKGETK